MKNGIAWQKVCGVILFFTNEGVVVEMYYLVDYENVHEKGLVGCDKLKKTDHMYIFYTENAKNVTLDVYGNHGKAELIVKKVPTGNQSLDIHLISYLGYLIGINEGKQVEYVIVSNDTGYDRISKFWKKEKGIAVSRRVQIAEKKLMPKRTQQQVVQKQKNSSINSVTKIDTKKKTKLNQDVQQVLSKAKAGRDRSVINAVAKVVSRHYGEEKFKSGVHNELRNMYPNDYLEIYAIIKPVISEYDV